MKALDLITSVFKAINVLGAGETPAASESADALVELNAMLDLWSTDRLFVLSILSQLFPLVTTQAAYQIGSSAADYPNANRPIHIETAYVLFTALGSTVRERLRIITPPEWDSLSPREATAAWPTVLYNDGAVPYSTLRLWPTPAFTAPTGAIANVAINSGGTGYVVNDTGTITGGGGTGGTYKVLAVSAGGVVTSVQITAGGATYIGTIAAATATGGAQPGVGTGLKLNIIALPELELNTWSPLTSFPDLTTNVVLAPGYEDALRYNLCVRLAPQFGVPLRPELVELAERSKITIQKLGILQDNAISPAPTMPAAPAAAAPAQG